MANNYEQIMALVNAGNKMGLSNTITRDNGIPLDLSSVYATYEDAVIYAATKAIAYIGQPIAVGDKLYIISDTAAEEKFTAADGTEYDNYLVEVGSKTEGDGLTIDLVDGVLMLHGIDLETTTAGMLPQVEVVDGKKQIKWVSISQIVEGDGNKITTLTSEDGSVVITKKEDTDASLVYDLSVTHPAAPEYAIAKDTRAEGATETTYHLTKDGENVDVAIVVPDAYNDSALAGRVSDVETAVTTTLPGLINDVDAKFADYTKTEDLPTDLGDFTNNAGYAKTSDVNTELAKKADKAAYDQTVLDLDALEAKVDAFLTGTGAEGALDSLQELIAYIDEHDGADLTEVLASIQRIESKLVLGTYEVNGETKEYATVKAYVEAAIEALNVAQYAKASDLEDVEGRVATLEAKPFDTYATKTEVSEARTGAVEDVAKVGYALATEVDAAYATKQSVTDLSNTIDAKLNDYAKTADVETELAKKIETGTIAHSSDTLAEGVTVDGTKLNIVVDAYTKQEVRDYVADVIEDMTGGESAADVLLALNNHIATYEEKVGQIDVKNGEQDTAIAAAQAQADKGVDDAAAAKSVADAAAAQAGTNKTDIAGHLARIGALESAKTGHETRISSLEGTVGHAASEGVEASGLVKAIADNAAAIGVLQGNIATLTSEDSRLAGLISANSTEIAKRAAQTDVDAINTKIGTVTEGTTLVQMIADAQAAATYDDTQVKQDIATNTSAIEAIYKAGSGVEGEEDYVAPSGLLVEEIARAKAAEEKNAADIALLLDNPDTEAIDSIKELLTYYEEHGEVLTQVDTRLDGHDAILAGIGGEGEPATVIAAIQASAYTLPAATIDTLGGVKASTSIAVAEDGTATVAQVSTDLLVQGVDELILYGGTATNVIA